MHPRRRQFNAYPVPNFPNFLGESSYGKPLLDRSLMYTTTLQTALKIGCLAFFSTRTATTDVDFPMDAVLYPRDSYRIWSLRFQYEDLAHVNEWWQNRLRASIDELPSDWLGRVFPLEIRGDAAG